MSLHYISVKKSHYKLPPKDKVLIYQVNSWKDSYSMWADGAIVTAPGNSAFSLGKIQVRGEILFEIKNKKTNIIADAPIQGELEISKTGSGSSNGFAYINLLAELVDSKNKVIAKRSINRRKTTDGKKKIKEKPAVTMKLDKGIYKWRLFVECQSEARKGWKGRVTSLLSRVDLKILGYEKKK